VPLGWPRVERGGRRLALGVLQVALTVAVTVVIVRRVGLGFEDLAALDRDAWRPSYALLSLSCLALLAGYVTSAAIWGRMVEGIGGPRLPLSVASEVYLVANLGRYLPGKLWQIAGLAALARPHGAGVGVSTAAAVLGQALALGGAALVGTTALAAGGAGIGAWSALSAGALVVIVAVALIPPLQHAAIDAWFRLAGHRELTLRPSGATTLLWLLLYTLNWVVYAAAFLMLARSFDLPGPAVLLASSFAAAYVLGYAVIVAPAGIGVREGFLVLFLSPAMGAGQATALSIIARVWTTAVELLPAAALWGLHLRRSFVRSGTAGEGATLPAPEEPEARALDPPGAP
jgi:hypothetical protein